MKVRAPPKPAAALAHMSWGLEFPVVLIHRALDCFDVKHIRCIMRASSHGWLRRGQMRRRPFSQIEGSELPCPVHKQYQAVPPFFWALCVHEVPLFATGFVWEKCMLHNLRSSDDPGIGLEFMV
eukprot:535865-Pelagomonas_calceolata.AAC.1